MNGQEFIRYWCGRDCICYLGKLFDSAANTYLTFDEAYAPPSGAEPTPGGITFEDSHNMNFENDAQRQKYELTKKLMQKQEIKNQQNKIRKEDDAKTINENKVKR